MTTEALSLEALPRLALAEAATTPDPGFAGVLAWSTTLSRVMRWSGTTWNDVGGPTVDLTSLAADGEVLYRSGTTIDGATGLIIGTDGLPLITGQTAQPAPPPTGYGKIYPRLRHGVLHPEMQRANGREFELQPHFGLNRIGEWRPGTGTTIHQVGMALTNVGTISHPTPASTSLATTMRRWRCISAATANSAADQRCPQLMAFRGDAAGCGGFRVLFRFSMGVLSTNIRGFYGLTSSVAAISTSQVPSALTNCFGVAFDATETTLRLQHNDASGTASRIDLGANFPTNNLDAVYTVFLYSAQNGTELRYRVNREDATGLVDDAVSTDMPSNTTFLAPRLYSNNGGDTVGIAHECSGYYLESDL